MPDIFGYTDFRKYLGDHYAERKAAAPWFSYRTFSDKIGFKSKDFIYRIINGTVRISQASIAKISSAMGHTAAEARHFESLVLFNQARTARERDFYFRQLRLDTRTTPSRSADVVPIAGEDLLLFSEWPLTAIRSLLEMVDVGDDASRLSALLQPPITPKRARSALRKLVKLGFIHKDEHGHYRPSHKALVTDDEVAGVALVRFYLECLKLAARAIDTLPRGERHVSGVTLGMSRAGYEKVVAILNRTRAEIAAVANDDPGPERVYQLQTVLFPLTVPLVNGGCDGRK